MTVVQPPTITVVDPVAQYDEAAAGYDDRYADPASQAENDQVAAWLTPSLTDSTGMVIDLGCGTGLLLDILGDRIGEGQYLGVDPSAGMLDRLAHKHPEYDTLHADAEHVAIQPGSCRLLTALFGAASYIHPDTLIALPEALAPGGRLFLMAYRPGYAPGWLYGEPLPQFDEAIRALTYLGDRHAWGLVEWHNFLILDSR